MNADELRRRAAEQQAPPTTPTESTRLWEISVVASFEAATLDEANARAAEVTALAFEHPAVWNATGEFDPEQEPEIVEGG